MSRRNYGIPLTYKVPVPPVAPKPPARSYWSFLVAALGTGALQFYGHLALAGLCALVALVLLCWRFP